MKMTILLSNLLTGTVVALLFTATISYAFISGKVEMSPRDYLTTLAEQGE